MTLQELENKKSDFLSAEEVAEYMGVGAQKVRDQAHYDAEKLGFPVIVLNTRILIPRLAFVHYMKYGVTQLVV